MGLLSGIHDFFLGTDAEKYDPNSEGAKAARTMGDPNHAYDIQASQAQGTQAAGADTGNYNQVRGQQQGVANNLNEAAAGRGPSAAGMAGAAQRDSNLSQAAALQSGRRGQSAGVGVRASNNAVVAGNQQASQNEAIGRANEMNTARGQQSGLLGTMAGQDVQVAGMGQQNNQFNAQLGQQNGQYNAGLSQQANQANQGAQLGIGNAELNQRARQEGLSYSNLQPSQQGFLSPSNVGTFIGAAISDPKAKSAKRRVDGSYGRTFSPRDAKYDIMRTGGRVRFDSPEGEVGVMPAGSESGARYDAPAPTGGPATSTATQASTAAPPGGKSPEVGQANLPTSSGKPSMDLPGMSSAGASIPAGSTGGGLLGPNQRVDPHWGANSAAAYGNTIGAVLANTAMQRRMEAEQEAKDSAHKAEDQAGSAGGGGGGGGGGGAGSGAAGAIMSNPEILAAFSDRRSKDDVRPVSRDDAREMFEEAPPYSYFYRPDARAAGAPPGRQVSVMWDDLQRTPAGRRMDGGREETTGYHTVDYLKGLPAAFASLSDLNERIARLESHGRK